MAKFPFYNQFDSMDCAPACLKMIIKYYGKDISFDELRAKCKVSRTGTSMLILSEAAEELGFNASGISATTSDFIKHASLPCVVYWYDEHFVVVYKITKKFVYVADPAHGYIKYTYKEFEKGFLTSKKFGYALLLSATKEFYSRIYYKRKKNQLFALIKPYFKKYSKFFFIIVLSLFLSSVFLLITPFLEKSIIDFGIMKKQLRFIYVLLFFQLAFFIGTISVSILRSWISIQIGTHINISIVGSFLKKLLKLDLMFLKSITIGDILNRISDNQHVDAFLTRTLLEFIFSLLHILIFGAVLFVFNFKIFLVFFGGFSLSIIWILFFLKKRKLYEYKLFRQKSIDQSRLINLLEGVEDLKISSAENKKTKEWQKQQQEILSTKLQAAKIAQFQNYGMLAITKLTHLIIIIFSATAIINKNMSLGMLLAISYILGQLNYPIQQILNFVTDLQDTMISLTRINDVLKKDLNEKTITQIGKNNDINLHDVSFSYGSNQFPTLCKLNAKIQSGKITAIVGESGSGKTTFMKMLLQFLQPFEGSIKLGSKKFSTINKKQWWKYCGVVLQDGAIFSDTVENNVALGYENIDQGKVVHALKLANIDDFVLNDLPKGIKTKIGIDGHSLSKGQNQRLLLARAFYRNPSYVFLDEATSALDASNESIVMKNFNSYFKNKTIIIAAHRLSTVKNADNIIVLSKGKIVEQGNHEALILQKGKYYDLVKNQLEVSD